MLMLLSSLALAHTNTRAHLDIRLSAQPGQLQLELRAKSRALVPLALAAAMTGKSLEALLATVIPAHITIYDGQRRLCSVTRKQVSLPGGDLRFIADYRCPLGELELRYDLLYATDPDHRVFATLHGLRPAGDDAKNATAPTTRVTTLDARRRTLRFTPRLASGATFRHFLKLGVHHIFSGYDHLLFLFALLLAAPLLRRATPTTTATAPAEPPPSSPASERPHFRTGLSYLIKIISAFTVAHSLTLAASALGWVRLPGRLVESAIAVSIIWVAVENLRWPTSRHRWVLVFVFGLVHGFGFAHVLAEIGLPRELLLITLLAFNLGVELGQLAVVALLFPLLHALAQPKLGAHHAALALALAATLFALLAFAGLKLGPWPWISGLLLVGALVLARLRGYQPVLWAGSLLVAAFGLLWLVQRAFDVKLLGGLLG